MGIKGRQNPRVAAQTAHTTENRVRGWSWSRALISAWPWCLPSSTLVPAEMDWVSRAQTGLSDCILPATNPAMEGGQNRRVRDGPSSLCQGPRQVTAHLWVSVSPARARASWTRGPSLRGPAPWSRSSSSSLTPPSASLSPPPQMGPRSSQSICQILTKRATFCLLPAPHSLPEVSLNLTAFLDLGANRSFILNSLLPWAWHPFLFSFQIFTLHLGLSSQIQPREKDLDAGGVFWRWSQEAQGRYGESQIEC